MDINKYSSTLDAMGQPSVDNLTRLVNWIESDGLPWLWVEMAGAVLTRKKQHPNANSAPPPPTLQPMSDSNAVRKGLMVSLSDRESMAKEPGYYHAQLTMLDAQASLYCKAAKSWLQSTTPPEDAAIRSLHRALLEMMRYARILLEQAAAGVTELPGYYQAGRRPFDQPFEVIHAARKFVHGAESGLAFSDVAHSAPVAVLRTAIELRIRDAFCISSLISSTDPLDTKPIDLGKVFEAISLAKSRISFAVDFDDVWRIYRWSNHYLHAGFRDFPWVTGFLIDFSWPLFVGVANSGNMNSGVQMSDETWREVRSSLAPKPEILGLKARVQNAWRALIEKPSARKLVLPECDPRRASFVLKS